MNTAINENIFNRFPVLESERLICRSFNQSDAETLFKLRSDRDVLKYMDADAHKSISDSDRMIESILKAFEEGSGINWVIDLKETNTMIGYIGFWRLMKENVRAEIGYALEPQFWGKGYMSEAIKIVLDFGFKQLRLHSVEANINPENERSEKLLEKMGFRMEAHFRENYYFNGRFLEEYKIFLTKAPGCFFMIRNVSFSQYLEASSGVSPLPTLRLASILNCVS